MRVILFLFLFSFNLLAQPGTTCCRMGDTSEDILKEETLSTKCLLCKNIHVEGFENFDSSASDEIVPDGSGIVKLLEGCQRDQRNIIDKIIKLMKRYKVFSNNKKISSFQDVLNELMILSSIDISQQMKKFSSEHLVKYGKCISKEEKDPEVIMKKEIAFLVKQVIEIEKMYNLSKIGCVNYKMHPKEEKILQQIETIRDLATKLET